MRLLYACTERNNVPHLLGGLVQGCGLGLERFHGCPHPLPLNPLLAILAHKVKIQKRDQFEHIEKETR